VLNSSITNDFRFIQRIFSYITLENKLQSWILNYKVSHNSVNCILNIKYNEIGRVKYTSIDVRMLMQTSERYLNSFWVWKNDFSGLKFFFNDTDFTTT